MEQEKDELSQPGEADVDRGDEPSSVHGGTGATAESGAAAIHVRTSGTEGSVDARRAGDEERGPTEGSLGTGGAIGTDTETNPGGAS